MRGTINRSKRHTRRVCLFVFLFQAIAACAVPVQSEAIDTQGDQDRRGPCYELRPVYSPPVRPDGAGEVVYIQTPVPCPEEANQKGDQLTAIQTDHFRLNVISRVQRSSEDCEFETFPVYPFALGMRGEALVEERCTPRKKAEDDPEPPYSSIRRFHVLGSSPWTYGIFFPASGDGPQNAQGEPLGLLPTLYGSLCPAGNLQFVGPLGAAGSRESKVYRRTVIGRDGSAEYQDVSSEILRSDRTIFGGGNPASGTASPSSGTIVEVYENGQGYSFPCDGEPFAISIENAPDYSGHMAWWEPDDILNILFTVPSKDRFKPDAGSRPRTGTRISYDTKNGGEARERSEIALLGRVPYAFGDDILHTDGYSMYAVSSYPDPLFTVEGDDVIAPIRTCGVLDRYRVLACILDWEELLIWSPDFGETRLDLSLLFDEPGGKPILTASKDLILIRRQDQAVLLQMTLEGGDRE